ncbi:MAG TPA: hypothetical protein DCX07_02570 [Phycisphaerales bacterium]|nr:hypothetical protein [Phycisphaerales bacterium]
MFPRLLTVSATCTAVLAALSAPALSDEVKISDRFSLNDADRKAGARLYYLRHEKGAGLKTEQGDAAWIASPSVILAGEGADGFATLAKDNSEFAGVRIAPSTGPITFSVRLRLDGVASNQWMSAALCFAPGHPTNNGHLWILVRPSGAYTVFAGASRLGHGSLKDFDSAKFLTVELTYLPSEKKFRVKFEGLSEPLEYDLGAVDFQPDIRAASVAVNGKPTGLPAFDDFTVTYHPAPAGAAPAVKATTRPAARPDPAIVRLLMQGAVDLVNEAYSKSSPQDETYYEDGVWHTSHLRKNEAYWHTNSGPAAAAAALWRSLHEHSLSLEGVENLLPAEKYFEAAVATIDRAIKEHQTPEGGFAYTQGQNKGHEITSMFFGNVLAATYLQLEPGLDEAHKTAWKKSLVSAADWMFRPVGSFPNAAMGWYTNGNIELGETNLWYLIGKITGEPRFKDAYETAFAFTIDPPKPRWKDYGIRYTREPTREDGSDGAAYLSEVGPGGVGYDPEYTTLQADLLTLLCGQSRDPKAIRLANLLTNELLERVDRNYWILDAGNGSRHTHVSRPVPFTVGSMTMLAWIAGRSDLGELLPGQARRLVAGYANGIRSGGPVYYRGMALVISQFVATAREMEVK